MTRHLAIVGGGWAGLSAAVHATTLGVKVSLFEASRQWGGRARRLVGPQGGDEAPPLDNGQHILIGAYAETLQLMQRVGVALDAAFEAVPLNLRYADGSGVATPSWARGWPAPADVLAAVATATGWTWADRRSFLVAAARWRWQRFQCPPDASVQTLCQGMTPKVMDDLIEPLCVAALNTPAARASGQVFLNVLRDALLGAGHGRWRASDLLLPRADLSALLPEPALDWLDRRGASCHAGTRIRSLTALEEGWRLHGDHGHTEADAVVLATPVGESCRLLSSLDQAPTAWLAAASRLTHEPIATVYLEGRLSRPWPHRSGMVALRSGPLAPAQYAFLRSQFLGPHRQLPASDRVHLALVASACELPRDDLTRHTLTQAQAQLGLTDIRVWQTVVDKRATFACVPGLTRPGTGIGPRLAAAGDYIDGPYPATLEGAVRSGREAVQALWPH